MKHIIANVSRISFLLLGIVLLLSSCSSGGGGSALPSIPLKTDTVRTEQPNDNWTYSISGSFFDVSTSQTYNITGTQSTLVQASTKTAPGGQPCRIRYSLTTIALNSSPGSPQVQYTYYDQDGAGDINKFGEGDQNSDKWITSDPTGSVLDTKSPVMIGDNYSYGVTYSNLDTETRTVLVIGKEYVATAIASYESYKATISQTSTYAQGTVTKEVITGTAWLVPGLGIVRQDLNLKSYVTPTGGGDVLVSETNRSLTLAGTNIAY